MREYSVKHKHMICPKPLCSVCKHEHMIYVLT
jgi:hypothetical protein